MYIEDWFKPISISPTPPPSYTYVQSHCG